MEYKIERDNMKTMLSDYDSESCKLRTPFPLFIMIHNKTNGDPCTTGCAWFDNGNCEGYKNLQYRIEPEIVKKSILTNKEIAKDLGCSKREVSRMRKNGILQEKYQ